MTDRLRDIRVRFERAKDNFYRFDDESSAYLAGPPAPCRVVPEVDSGGNGRIIVKDVTPIPSSWTLLVADTITELRITLDYLAYQLVIRNTGQDPPPNAGALEFPIFKDEGRFLERNKNGEPTNRSGLAKIKDMSADVQRFITDIQPYKNVPPEDDGLWVLHDLCNIYKHRLLSPALLQIGRIDWSIGGWSIDSIEDFVIHDVAELKDDAVVATFRVVRKKGVRPIDPEIYVNTQPHPQVGFEPGSPGENRYGVHLVLSGGVGTVRWIVDELTKIGDLTAP